MGSPTSRSLKNLRERGFLAEVVEKFNFFSKTRKDLFGMFDILAFNPHDVGVMGVQTTSGSHMTDRKKKICENPFKDDWLESQNRIEVHGWRKVGKKGKRKTWDVAIHEF